MEKLKINIGNEEFNINGIYALYKEMLNKYELMLSLTSEILNGYYMNPSALSRIYSTIKEDILRTYTEVKENIEEEFSYFLYIIIMQFVHGYFG